MGFDVIALAKRINQRREEFNRLYPNTPVRITSAMSRILENDPDYVPYRRRAGTRRRQPSRNPTVRTLVEIADALGTTVGDLLGEKFILAPADRAIVAGGLRVIEKILRQQESARGR